MAGTRYIVTVVPKPGYKLSGWAGDTTSFANPTLLTTSYITTPDTTMNELTAIGELGSYPSMQDFTTCSTTGDNVTDIRDSKSYTVAKINNYCFMLSNLRLAGSTDDNTVVLNSDTTNFYRNDSVTMPNQNIWGEDYGPKMLYIENEYYYNRATAQPFGGSSSTIRYDICPKGWTIIGSQASTLWDNGNLGMFYISGYIYNREREQKHGVGFWLSSRRNQPGDPYVFELLDNSFRFFEQRDGGGDGYSIRCQK